MADDTQDRGFKVVDRRSFDQDGKEREGTERSQATEAKAQAEESKAEAATQATEDASSEDPEEGADSLPEVDFVTFILSLHSSAACLLGKVPYPDSGQCEVNLPMAKQTIDILSMLQEKTKGNLTGEEERIVSEMLYDLRMAYVQAAKQ